MQTSVQFLWFVPFVLTQKSNHTILFIKNKTLVDQITIYNYN